MSVVTYQEAVKLNLKPALKAGQLWYKIRYPNGLYRGHVLCVVRADLTLSPLDDGPYPDGDKHKQKHRRGNRNTRRYKLLRHAVYNVS